MERRWEEVPIIVDWVKNIEVESAMSVRPANIKKENMMMPGLSTSFDSRGNSVS